MFLLDDLLLAPLKNLAAVCRKVHEAAEQELEGQERNSLQALTELYQQLEMREIDEAECDRREAQLLRRLDALRGGGARREAKERSTTEARRDR